MTSSGLIFKIILRVWLGVWGDFGLSPLYAVDTECVQAEVQRYFVAGAGVSAEDIRFHEQTLREIEEMLGPLEVPPRRGVSVFIHAAEELGVVPTALERRLVASRAGSASNARTRRNYDPILAHEFGHQVFDINCRRLFNQDPRLAELRRRLSARFEEQRRVQGARGGFDSLGIGGASDPEFQALLQATSWDRINNNGRNTRLRQYSELYADLVAVLHSEDGSAVANGLRAFGAEVGPNLSAILSARDFHAENRVQGWQAAETDAGVHHYYGPVRSFLGRSLGTLDNARKARILEATLRAVVDLMVQDSLYRYEHGRERVMSAEDRNRALITAIEHHL